MEASINDYKKKFGDSGYILLSPTELNILDRYMNSVYAVAMEDNPQLRAEIGYELAIVLDVIFELNGKKIDREIL